MKWTLLGVGDRLSRDDGPVLAERLFESDWLAVDRMLVSTHGLPISFFLDRLESAARETVILGIESADLSFGEGLSTEVNAAV